MRSARVGERRPILGLSVRQPWAHYIVRGPKRVENRTWAPPAWMLGGYVAIHAAKKRDEVELRCAQAFVKRLRAAGKIADGAIAPAKVRDLPLGAVVGVARVAGWETRSDDPRHEAGCIGWQLADVVAIAPVRCRGHQGLWELPDDVLATVRARWKAAQEAA